MSQENVELVKRSFEAFSRGGIEAALSYFDPEVEWIGPPEWLEDHLYKGHDGMRKIASVWGENFDEYRLDLDKAIDAGDRVVVLACQRGRIKGSSDWMEQQVGYDWEVRNGKGVRVQVYFSWGEALEAAGLEE